MPSTGVITRINFPTGPGVRVDTGVYEGFEVTPFYDSMIAKLVCWGRFARRSRIAHAPRTL